MQPVDKLMARLTALFGEPKTEDLDTMLEEFRHAMGRYSADVLKEVGDRCRDQFKWWPRIAELITLANDAKWDLEAPSREAERRAEAKQEQAKNERELANRASKDRVDAMMKEFREAMAKRDVEEALRRPRLTPPTREDFEAMQDASRNVIHRKSP